MSLIDRFLTAFRGEDRGAAEPPGLLLDADGVTWLVSPDGSRARVSNSGSSSVLASVVPVSSAEILALHDNPVTLIAAPAAGKAIVPISVSVAYRFGTTPYTNDNGSPEVVRWEASSIERIYPDPPCLAAAASRVSLWSMNAGDGISEDASIAVQSPLILTVDAAAPDFVGGDGTAEVTVVYVLADLT